MLTLTRKLNESIIIGDDIKIEVIRISKNKIRLGISAPRDVSVHREEIYNKIQKEQLDGLK